jgi:hypothetical protein
MEFIYSIHKLEVDARGFIANGKKWKESKIAERQRERACVRGSVLQQEKDSVGNKTDR